MSSYPRLEEWRIVEGDRIRGLVYGHPEFEDGTLVFTSRVAWLDKETGHAITKNTNYVLGKPYPEVIGNE